MRWMMIRLMPTSMFDTDEGPGDSLSLLPDAPLPSEFQWAAARPEIAGAFARFIAVCTAAGKETLSEPVCELTEAYVGGWNGEDPGLGRRWLADAVSELTPSDRTAARIVLLAAIASYQIDDKVVEEFRNHYPEDRQLISAIAWGGQLAIRRIASWLHLPGKAHSAATDDVVKVDAL